MHTSSEGVFGTKILTDFDPGRTFNILVFGPPDCGRSSLINACFSDTDHISRRAATRDVTSPPGRITKTFSRYSFNENVSLFDVWGMPRLDTDDLLTFRRLLDGEIPLGTRVGDSPTYKKDGTLIIHSVVFCIPSSVYISLGQRDWSIPEEALEEHEKGLILKLKRFVHVCTERSLPIVFVLTKMDDFFQSVVEEPFQVDLRSVPEADSAFSRMTRPNIWGKKLYQPIKRDLGIQCCMVPMITYQEFDEFPDALVTKCVSEFVWKLTSQVKEVIQIPRRKFLPNVFRLEEKEVAEVRFREFEKGGSRRTRISSVREIPTSLSQFPILHQSATTHIFFDIYYKPLRIAGLDCRLFVAGVPIPPTQADADGAGRQTRGTQIVGVWDPVNWVLYETVHSDGALKERFVQSFGRQYVTYYDYLDETLSRSSQERTESSECLRFSLGSGSYQVYLRRMPFAPLHAALERTIQTLKHARHETGRI